LNLDYGRFAAALTWYAKLFDLDPTKTDYRPDKVTEKQAKIVKEAAKKAVRKPYRVSKVR
jgi:4-hydroxyphenylpyruvate dioxygenase-like putative hemolysin